MSSPAGRGGGVRGPEPRRRAGEDAGSSTASPTTGIRLTARDRLFAWLVTGPLGRLAAFVADLAAAWWGWARRRL